MEDNVKFWDKMAVRYSKKPIENMEVYQRKLDITQRYINQSSEVIELGCGTGSTALIHAQHAKHIRATDLSANMLKIAHSKAQAQNIDNVDFEVVSVDDLKVVEPVDMVLALSLLHLLQDKDAALEKIIKWLKPGGTLISSTVCLQDTMPLFKFIGPIGRWLGLMPLVRIFSAAQLKQSMQEVGFEIEYDWCPEKSMSVFIVARKPW